MAPRAGNATKHDRAQRSGVAHAAVLVGFLIAALWNSRAVLSAPASVVALDPAPPARTKREATLSLLRESDIRRNIAQTAYVTRSLSSDPRHFFDGQMCFPTAGVTFGEHMLGEGILGLPAYLLWSDPVVTFNFVVTLQPFIGAAAMYALAYYWTESIGAALIAGFLFGFHPTRLGDLIHPSVVGNEWIPAILLSLHLLFTRLRWRYAFLLTVFCSLQLLESMYVLLQLAFVAGIYGAYLLWRRRDAIPALLPKLAFVAGSLALVAFWVLGPYLATREVWGILQGRRGIPTPNRFFWIGYRYYPGTCLLVLASLGLLDRFRGPRAKGGYDPRFPLVVAGLIAAWFVFPWRVPGTDLAVRSLRALLLPWIPGLNGVRAPDNVFFATAVTLALLAAYGVRAVVAKLGREPQMTIVVLIASACVAEVFLPALAKRSSGRRIPPNAFFVRPPEDDLAAVRELPPDPVLDFPLRTTDVIGLSRYVFLGSYHGRRQAACKASFQTPAQLQVAAIARRLPAPAAARELWALGLRTIIFHDLVNRRARRRMDRIVRALSGPSGPHLVPFSQGRGIRVFRLTLADEPTTTDVTALSPVVGSQLVRAGRKIELRFGVRAGDSIFRHPDPVLPTKFLLTWKKDGVVAKSEKHRALLPLALAPEETAQVVVESRAPRVAGEYDVTLVSADRPRLILAKARVVVAK